MEEEVKDVESCTRLTFIGKFDDAEKPHRNNSNQKLTAEKN